MKYTEDFPQEKLERLLKRTSFNGLMTLYAFKIAHDKQVGFSLLKLTGELAGFNYQYCWGFTIACNSLGIFTYTIQHGIYNVISYEKYLADNIKSTLEQRVKKIPSTKNPFNPASIVFKDMRKSNFETVEKFFK